MQDAGNSMQTDLDGDGDVIYVWGTNLTIASVTKGIRRFYTTFRTPDQRADDDPKYLGLIRRVRALCCTMAQAEPGLHVRTGGRPSRNVLVQHSTCRNASIDRAAHGSGGHLHHG